MNVKLYSKRVTRHFIKIGECSYTYSDIMQVLEALDGSDMMETVVIDSKSLQGDLEELGVIKTNIRGSSYAGEYYRKFYEAVSGAKLNEEFSFYTAWT